MNNKNQIKGHEEIKKKKKSVYEYLERRKCILDLQIVGIGNRIFGGSVYVIYNRGLISFFSLTIIIQTNFTCA